MWFEHDVKLLVQHHGQPCARSVETGISPARKSRKLPTCISRAPRFSLGLCHVTWKVDSKQYCIAKVTLRSIRIDSGPKVTYQRDRSSSL